MYMPMYYVLLHINAGCDPSVKHIELLCMFVNELPRVFTKLFSNFQSILYDSGERRNVDVTLVNVELFGSAAKISIKHFINSI